LENIFKRARAVKTVNSWSLASGIPILGGADLGSLPTNSLVYYLFEKKGKKTKQKTKKTLLRRKKNNHAQFLLDTFLFRPEA